MPLSSNLVKTIVPLSHRAECASPPSATGESASVPTNVVRIVVARAVNLFMTSSSV